MARKQLPPDHVVACPILLNKRDAGAYIGVSERVIERYLQEGLLTAMGLPNGKDGGLMKLTLIAREELDRFVLERCVVRQ